MIYRSVFQKVLFHCLLTIPPCRFSDLKQKTKFATMLRSHEVGSLRIKTINTDKRGSLSFADSEPSPIEAFGAEIRSQSHCKKLGVYLEAKLTFWKHLEHVTKLNNFCGIVYKIRDCFSQKNLNQFHYASAPSVFTYSFINSGSIYKTDLEPLDKAQRKISQFLVGASWSETRLL